MTIATRNISKQNARTGVLTVCLAGFLVSGCSSTPDWANPAEWYRDTKDWVSGSPSSSAQPPQASTPIPGKGKSFPKLASVPARPAAPSEAERKKMAKSLAADRKAARYSDEKIRRQDENVTAAAASAPVSRAVPKAVSAPVARAVQVAPVVAPSLAPTRAAPAQAMTADKMVKPVFGQAPADIVMRGQPVTVARPAFRAPTPAVRSRQNFVQAQQFSTRFPAGAGTVLAPVHSGANNTVATIRFNTGSAKLTSGARGEIRKAVAAFKQRGGGIHVIGHASSRTRNLNPQRHQLANFRVSYNRANVVARELRRLGVAATAIRVSAVSDTQPAFLEVMPAGEAGNRRVEIVIEN
jgi:outer membrane protein OmpA-like peptidoglycan-associated protein